MLDQADRTYNGINASIDKFIDAQGIDRAAGRPLRAGVAAGERTARASTSRRRASPASSGASASRRTSAGSTRRCSTGAASPLHVRGVTHVPGLYFLGLPWLHTWGSGRFSGVARDALHLATQIELRLEAQRSGSSALAPSALLPA